MVVDVYTECPFCQAVKVVNCDKQSLENWHNGMLIQKAFPEMNNDDRESLISGICSHCWETIICQECED